MVPLSMVFQLVYFWGVKLELRLAGGSSMLLLQEPRDVGASLFVTRAHCSLVLSLISSLRLVMTSPDLAPGLAPCTFMLSLGSELAVLFLHCQTPFPQPLGSFA